MEVEKRAKETAWTWAWSGKTVEIGSIASEPVRPCSCSGAELDFDAKGDVATSNAFSFGL